MLRSWLKPMLALVAFTGLMGLIIAEADARPGRGGGAGSRGSRTYTPPPATNAAPTQARPIERSATQPGQPGQPAATAAARPGAAAPAAGGMFSRPGLLGGLAAGFLGAGLLGMLMGNGLLGGLGSLASMFGLLLQVALIGGAIWLVLRWWRNRSQPTPAYAGGRSNYNAPEQPGRHLDLGSMANRSGMGAAGSMLGGLGATRAAEPSDELGITPADYDAFEKLLTEVQDAYGREDLNALRTRASPEMLSYFTEEMTENTSRGLINHLSGTKLLQGDLAEAWREDQTEYATVAMRYELVDRMVERDSGRTVEGDEATQEVTELWTFRRARGHNWMLSAIQQTD